MNKEILFFGDYRLDGRKSEELRRIEIKTDVVKESNGSCLFSQGDTIALCWINGPKEGRGRGLENTCTIKCMFTLASFSYTSRKKDFKRDLQMKEFSNSLRDIFTEKILLDHYQRSEIEINILITQNDGSFKSAAINAASIALINAGILMKETIVSIAVGVNEEISLIDLSKEEENLEIPILTVCYLPKKKTFSFIELINAQTPYNKIDSLLDSAEVYAEKVYSTMKQFLKNNYLKN